MDNKKEFKPTYTQRLCEKFEEGKKYSHNSIVEIIKEFAKLEYDEKKKNSDKIPFGKYNGRYITEVFGFDKNYIMWLSRQDLISKFPELKDNIDKLLTPQ
jgi:uncharacterized protein (DUF3820 family)